MGAGLAFRDQAEAVQMQWLLVRRPTVHSPF